MWNCDLVSPDQLREKKTQVLHIWTGFLIFVRSDINEKSNAEKLISLL